MDIKRRDLIGGLSGALLIPTASAQASSAPIMDKKYKDVMLSTHILDMVSGKPAGNVKVVLYQDNKILFEGHTNKDGRCAVLQQRKERLSAGYYQLAFYIADYFKAQGYAVTDPPFLNIVRIDFGIAKNPTSDHYHVPLLVSPYGFSTYKGS